MPFAVSRDVVCNDTFISRDGYFKIFLCATGFLSFFEYAFWKNLYVALCRSFRHMHALAKYCAHNL